MIEGSQKMFQNRFHSINVLSLTLPRLQTRFTDFSYLFNRQYRSFTSVVVSELLCQNGLGVDPVPYNSIQHFVASSRVVNLVLRPL